MTIVSGGAGGVFVPDSRIASVLLIAGAAGDTGRYRVLHAGEQLRLAGVPWSLHGSMERTLRPYLRDAVVAIFHRVPYDPHVDTLIREVEDAGAVPVFDVDDLIFDPSVVSFIANPKLRHPAYASLHRDQVFRYRRTLERCHGVVASTVYLAALARAFGKSAWIHRNAFSLEMLSLSDRAYERRPRRSERMVIGYASGTPTHARDFEAVKPVLRRVLEEYPRVELWVVGHLNPGRDWGGVADRVRRIPFVPWRQLPAILAQFDVSIAPLEINNPFCRSKSELKYIEAALVRVPTIASATEAFQYAIESWRNGLLASRACEWLGHLRRMIDDPGLRQRLGERAYEDVVARYHPAVRSPELVCTLNEVGETMRGARVWPDAGPLSPSAAGVHYVADADRGGLDVPALIARGLYSLRYRGVRHAALGVLYLLTSWMPLQNEGGRVSQ